MKGIYIVVTPFFPSEDSYRGIYILDQVKAIKRQNKFKKIIVFIPDKYFHKETSYCYDGIEVHTFHFLQMPSYIFNGLTNNINGKLFVKTLKKLRIHPEEIAIIHAHVSYFAACALAVKRQNSKIITLIQHHDRDPLTIRNGKLSSWRFNIRFKAQKNIKLLSQIDYNISISKVVEDNLLSFPKPGKYENYLPYVSKLKKIQHLNQINIKNSIVLYNGVDLTKFYQYPNKEAHYNIGCIGNFVDLKDQITLIKAIEILVSSCKFPSLRVTFIGNGPTLEFCKNYTTSHDLKCYIKYIPEIENDKLIDFYNSIDLFVLPSCYEGFGCVYTEAYACGAPFIACENQGAAECIEPNERDKWLIKPHDYQQLAKLIERYFVHRDIQHLSVPIDINILIKDFLNKIY